MYNRRSQPSEPHTYRDAVFLAHTSPAEASQWLADRVITYSATSGTPQTPPDAHVLEYILFRRNEPLIDLALAEHGRSKTVLERVFARSRSSVRILACSNASLFVGETIGHRFRDREKEPLFWDIIRNGSLAELRSICENPNLTSGMYAGLITSWVGSTGSYIDEKLRLSDERFQQVVRFLANNPRLRVDRDNSKEKYYLDGYADYEYGILTSECWKLAAIVPVDQNWAYYLSQLYDRMIPEYKPFDNIEEIFNRWRPPDEGSYAPTRTLREVLAKHFLEPSKDTLSHDDEAIRRAFYLTFDPTNEDFIEQDWSAWCAKDKYCELELQSNKNIWKNARSRSKLRRLLWELSRENSDITSVGWFDEREDTYRKKHPEWFADEDTFEEKFDEERAKADFSADVQAANALRGASAYEPEALANDMLGRQMLREDLGEYGTGGLPTYQMDDETRDRLIAHVRQDVAAVFGHAKSAFQTAKEAEKAAKRTGRIAWLLVILLVANLLMNV